MHNRGHATLKSFSPAGSGQSKREQLLSVLNVPLMWAAAARDDQCAVMQWPMAKREHLRLFYFHGDMSCAEAARISWEVFRNAMHNWNISSREFLSLWTHSKAFPRPRWGLNFVIARYVRGAVFESLSVHIAMSLCHQIPVAQIVSPQHEANAIFFRFLTGGVGQDQFGRGFPDAFLNVPRMLCAVEREIWTSGSGGFGSTARGSTWG